MYLCYVKLDRKPFYLIKQITVATINYFRDHKTYYYHYREIMYTYLYVVHPAQIVHPNHLILEEHSLFNRDHL